MNNEYIHIAKARRILTNKMHVQIHAHTHLCVNNEYIHMIAKARRVLTSKMYVQKYMNTRICVNNKYIHMIAKAQRVLTNKMLADQRIAHVPLSI